MGGSICLHSVLVCYCFYSIANRLFADSHNNVSVVVDRFMELFRKVKSNKILNSWINIADEGDTKNEKPMEFKICESR